MEKKTQADYKEKWIRKSKAEGEGGWVGGEKLNVCKQGNLPFYQILHTSSSNSELKVLY